MRQMNGSLEIECRIDPKFFDNPDNMAQMGSVASREDVNAEVSTLLDLLDSVGAREEIRRLYHPLREPDELSSEERASLPERALKYIEKLEGELRELEARNHQTENRLRKAN